ncbi:MAG: AraC family transcriptional regulator [Proteobacteria bacterium]|nr:AraC family transcriptional regulator [Pseudomonadota bacterium]
MRQLIIKVDQGGGNSAPIFTQALLQAIHEENNHTDYTLTFPTHRLLHNLIPYIDLHLEQPVSIEVVAQKANMSARHLSRVFKQETGLSFSHWLQQYKMLYALVLLPQYKSTSVVAKKLGYDSDSAFISSFKKLTHGKLPSYFY